MTGALRAAASDLPVVIAGAGPGGMSTAVSLYGLGEAAQVFEARISQASRARNIFLRPPARRVLAEFGLKDPGTDTTISRIENQLREVAQSRGIPVSYRHEVVDVSDAGDHLAVRVRGDAGEHTVRARALVDATGGRLRAANVGELERVPAGPRHMYVTAQYDTPPASRQIAGVFDRSSGEAIYVFPISDASGFIAYFDQPVGRVVDEQAMLARYDRLAGELGLGTPITRPQLFDARQHLARSASAGRLVKVGDSVGNADPYIGAGLSSALVDGVTAARALHAARDLTRPDGIRIARAAGEEIVARHRTRNASAGMLMRVRDLGLRLFPDASFDRGLTPHSLRPSGLLTRFAGFLSSRE